MKKMFVGIVLAVLLSAGQAMAFALADNDQTQVQGDGGFAAAGFLGAGQIGGAGGFQQGDGFSLAEPGDYATESQAQSQIQNDSVGASNGGGNFSGSAWSVEQNQQSFSESAGGIAGNWQAQAIVGGSAGVTAFGQVGVAGSAGAAIGASVSGALGNAQAANQQDQTYEGVYTQQSVNPITGGYVFQTGYQQLGTNISSGAAFAGVGGASAGVIQAGGTAVQNNGQGTSMQGAGTAAGAAYAVSGGVGNAGGSAEAAGYQSHSYEQLNTSADGTSQQYATGNVQTQVYAAD